MTAVTTASQSGTHVHIFHLLTSFPSTDPATVAISGNEASREYMASMITYTNGGGDCALEDDNQATGNSTTPTVDLTTAGGQETAVSGAAADEHGTLGQITEQLDTLLHEVDFGGQVGSIQRYGTNPTGGTVTVNWVTSPSADTWAVNAIAIKDAGGGGGGGCVSGSLALLGAGC